MVEADVADGAVLQSLATLSRKITAAVERPEDVIITQAFGMYLSMCIRVCIELNMFELLVQSSEPLTAHDLAGAVNAEELLVVRLMRGVTSLDFASEVAVNTYTANAVTKALVTEFSKAGFTLTYDIATRPRAISARVWISSGPKASNVRLQHPTAHTSIRTTVLVPLLSNIGFPILLIHNAVKNSWTRRRATVQVG